jgi:hypothetical protein
MIRYLKLLVTFLKVCITNSTDVSKALFNSTEDIVAKNIAVNKYKLLQGLKTIDLLELFPNFQESLINYSFLEGTSLITDIAILKKLAQRFDQCDYIEFGSWRGESIVNVATVTDNCTSLSFSNEEMKQFKLPPDVINCTRVFLKNTKSIKHIEHNT